MRQLKTSDLFSAMRVVKAAGIKDEIKRIALENESKKDGRRYILATAHPDNRFSTHILEKHLFIPAGVIEEYHSFRRILYQRIL